MNKYKDALTYLRNSVVVTDHKQKERVNQCTAVLQELVDKETPKKSDYEVDGCDRKGEIVCDTWICPNCEKKYEVDYDIYDRCPNCGQAIDADAVHDLVLCVSILESYGYKKPEQIHELMYKLNKKVEVFR